ncbi:MAG: cytochrome C [Deltaproteobacteria bacterium]|nr:cytochrome C [Deltaproteobacteria bacterium]
MSAEHAVVRPHWSRARRGWVVGLSLLGVLAFGASFFFPWWTFQLFAPQYPKGLELVIALTGVAGDVAEINTINHYIGMGHIDDAAKLEREFAHWLIGGLGVAVVAAMLFAGKKFTTLGAWFAVGLPLGFVLDTQYWLYRFGHDLDPRAAIDIPPFTPVLFGEGKVGQFRTLASPDLGFWLAVAGVALMAAAMYHRWRVCGVCPSAGKCGATCSHAFVRIPK